MDVQIAFRKRSVLPTYSTYKRVERPLSQLNKNQGGKNDSSPKRADVQEERKPETSGGKYDINIYKIWYEKATNPQKPGAHPWRIVHHLLEHATEVSDLGKQEREQGKKEGMND